MLIVVHLMNRSQQIILTPPETATIITDTTPPPDSFIISTQTLSELLHTLTMTQTALKQQCTSLFHASIACQTHKQVFLSLNYARQCMQLRKLRNVIQDKQFRLHQLHQLLLVETSNEDRIKLETYAQLIIETLREHLAGTPPQFSECTNILVNLLDTQPSSYY
jgi:hypothetical protein